MNVRSLGWGSRNGVGNRWDIVSMEQCSEER